MPPFGWLLLVFAPLGGLKVIDKNVLVALGAAYSLLWKYHWRCFIDEEPSWVTSAAINMVGQDHCTLFLLTLLQILKLVPWPCL